MALPPAFYDELRSRLTLSEIIGKRIRLARAGREFKGCCPFHKEKTPSFYVNDEKQFFHCFGCGAHGDVIGFVMRHDGLSFLETIESLAAQAGMSVPQDSTHQRERYDKQKRLLHLLEIATLFFEEQLLGIAGKEARDYLQSRGVSKEAQQRFRIGYAPHESQSLLHSLQSQGFSLSEILEVGLIKKAENRPDHFSFFRNRVMFPVADKRGRIIAFGGRVMGNCEPKYLNSPDHSLFHKGKHLYGLSKARAAISQGQPFIVVEGYMDVIALAEAGFIGAVAPLGTALTEDQLSLLWSMLPPIDARDPSRDYSPILCFDGDNAGIRAASRAVNKAIPLLTAEHTARVAYLPPTEDPDSLLKNSGRGPMQAVLDQAKSMIDVVWDTTLSGRRLKTPEDRSAVVSSIRMQISKIQDESLRTLYKDEIEKRLKELFGWNDRTKDGSSKSISSKAPLLSISQKQTAKHLTNGMRLREKILLALMVNYPLLFNEFGEDFASIAFSDTSFEDTRQQLVNILSGDSHESLDATTLYRQLSVGAASSSMHNRSRRIDEILSESTYMHAGFARPGREFNQARQGWKSIWNNYLREQLQVDLQAAGRLWHEEPSDANLARLMALRQQMENLANESVYEIVESSGRKSFEEKV